MKEKAYKGFDKDLKCRGFQYEVGETYETPKAKLCEEGFHACEAPLDVLRYYPPNNGRYCEVELDDVSTERSSDDTKIVGKKITIGGEIGIPGLIKAHVEYTREMASKGKTGGDWSNLAGGDRSNLAGGDWSNLAGGDRSNLAGGGRSNLAGGDWSNLAGGYSSLIVGRNESKAKAGINSVIVLSEWQIIDGKYKPVAVKADIVDGEKIKPDTWYTLKNGEFVEVDENA